MRLTVTATSPVPRDVLYAWWTDYQPDDHRTSSFKSSNLRVPFTRFERRVVRKEKDHVVLEDRGRLLGVPWRYESHVTFHPPDLVREESTGPYGAFSTEYLFLPQGGGTRLIMDIDGGHPWLAVLEALGHRLAREDLARHLADAEREWRRDRG